MTNPEEPQSLKLSEAAKLCGISAETLQLLIADELLPQAVRSARGHAYLPAANVPTWQHCRQLVLRKRDRHLRRAADLIARVEVELEAIRNDITEAREHPAEPLGVDLLGATSYATYNTTTTLAAMLQQLDLVRMQIVCYHAALQAIVDKDRGYG
ncbi:hypothetical protein [Mycobacterium sp. 1245852.3]|uniref:MerR family transcriptional regulator n=1 Tax=Mycobacterium sp. 1245852.3 TaxID=1856860 RepID=UPI0008018C7D|nr:hypothetical protein [Mycobacterium sp. 1245852.3]OBJ81115.1 hypothetical protein A9W96_29680 [Mycobacterium sp. 1245852.3]